MATEADDNLTAEPTATRELISAAIEAVKSQGQDINPYSVAHQAQVAAEAIFFNRELMSAVIEARGDKATFSIDSQLAERCQELESEMAKLMQINSEIYDRALEMEERVIQLEAKITDLEEESETLTMQLQNSWHLGYKKGQADAQVASAEAKEQWTRAQEAMADGGKAQQSKPKEEAPAKKSIIDIELSQEEKEAIQREAAEKAHSEKKESGKQSIMSMIDIELPGEDQQQDQQQDQAPAAATQTDFSAEQEQEQEGRDTSEHPPVSGEHAPVNEAPAPQPVAAVEAPGAYNDRVYNAVADSYSPSNMVESYGGLSWREVETIYQFSANSSNAGPNMVYEPMSQTQAEAQATAQATVPAAAAAPTQAPAQTQPVPSSRTETQPINTRPEGQPSRSDTQPIFPQAEDQGAAPPILKADAPAPKPEHKPNPSSTFTRLTAKKPEQEPDPPMEITMSQFLGDTQSYINLDRVTLEPEESKLAPPPVAPAQPEPQVQVQAQAQAQSQAPAASEEPPPAPQSQLETQTLQGAAQAMAAAAAARASGAIPPGDSAAFMAAASAAANAQAAQAAQAAEAAHPQTPQQAAPAPAPAHNSANIEQIWGRRDAGATYDGLTALDSDSTNDILDLEKLDIFEGLEDIDELSQIEVIEDVIIPPAPGAAAAAEAPAKKGRYKSSEHIPVVSSDDLHDLIKSRIKKAEEPPRADAFISHPGDKDKPAATGPAPGSNAAAGAENTTSTSSAPSVQAGAAAAAESAPPPVPTAKELEALRQGARNKFVGGKAAAGAPAGASSSSSDSLSGAPSAPTPGTGISPRAVPPEIRKACMILGVRPEELTVKEVHEKWKAQIAAPGAHPDQGGDTESAIYLNTAKDTLVKWINDQAPKLGKKFGKGEK
ncbi:MAG: hypothetical protein JSS83_16815 [Cyanobacteria bacterium SZAS LIN-3]|nr:hypothetical protein [Cyanobacteria bacterium SZAS LIN-3]